MEWQKYDLKERYPPCIQYRRFLVTDGKEYSVALFGMDTGGDGQFKFWFMKENKPLYNITYWLEIPVPPDFDEAEIGN